MELFDEIEEFIFVDTKEKENKVKRWIDLAKCRLSRLHSTEIIKKDRRVIEEYDGSGRIHIPSIPNLFKRNKRIMLPQKKRKGFLKDKPDLIIMLDVSGSIRGGGDGSNDCLCNKLRILCGSIGDIFLADLNQIHIIIIGYGSSYANFKRYSELEKWLNEQKFKEGATNYVDAFNCLNKSGILNEDRPRLIVMITDGEPNEISYEMQKRMEEILTKGNWWEIKTNPKLAISKSYILKMINHITMLSKLKDTIYKTIVIHECEDEIPDKEMIEEERNRIYERLKGGIEANVKNDGKEIQKELEAISNRYIEEFYSKAIHLSSGQFKTGEAFHKIIEGLKKEIYKYEHRR